MDSSDLQRFIDENEIAALIDPAVTRQERIYGGGGEIDAMLRLTPGELLTVTGGEITELSD